MVYPTYSPHHKYFHLNKEALNLISSIIKKPHKNTLKTQKYDMNGSLKKNSLTLFKFIFCIYSNKSYNSLKKISFLLLKSILRWYSQSLFGERFNPNHHLKAELIKTLIFN